MRAAGKLSRGKSWSRLSAQDSAKAKWTAAGVGPLRFSRAGRAGGASRARRKFHAAAARVGDRSKPRPACAGQGSNAGAADCKGQIAANRGARLAHAIVGFQVDLLVFDASPQSLDEHVVAPGALAVHARIETPLSSSMPVKAKLVNWADLSGRRNTLTGVAMNIRKRRSDRSGRVRLFSPGRPPVAGREERRRFWAAIAAGTASEDAAVGVGVPQAVGTRWFRKAGGMPPSMFGLSAKPLSGRYLSFAEREEIALLRVQGYSMQEVARRLGRVASTISRELRRNAATRSGGLEYRATTAQWHAERAARRPKQAKLARNATLRTYVEERLAGVVVAPSGAPVPGPVVSWKSRRHGPRKDRRWANAWSPEQIARRLPVDFPDDATMRISHEAIYQALFVQGRGALRRELTACLRTGRVLRMPRARTRGRGKTFISPEIMISQRPAEAADRAVPGHWEGDLILGLGSSAIGTLVERTTRFTLLLYLPRMAGHGLEARVKNGPALAGHGAEAVRDAITRTIVTLPEQLRRSLTWDQGAEMAQHARLKIEAGVRVYFCDPHSPWQRGTNENTNGLLRQYFPKGPISACTAPTRLQPELWRKLGDGVRKAA